MKICLMKCIRNGTRTSLPTAMMMFLWFLPTEQTGFFFLWNAEKRKMFRWNIMKPSRKKPLYPMFRWNIRKMYPQKMQRTSRPQMFRWNILNPSRKKPLPQMFRWNIQSQSRKKPLHPMFPYIQNRLPKQGSRENLNSTEQAEKPILLVLI